MFNCVSLLYILENMKCILLSEVYPDIYLENNVYVMSLFNHLNSLIWFKLAFSITIIFKPLDYDNKQIPTFHVQFISSSTIILLLFFRTLLNFENRKCHFYVTFYILKAKQCYVLSYKGQCLAGQKHRSIDHKKMHTSLA